MSSLAVFTAKNVRRLTGFSDRQLRYWDDIGLFSSRDADEKQREPDSRIYSFRDVVVLRTLALLRDKHEIPLNCLQRVGEWLAQHVETPWSDLQFYVAGQQVFFDKPPTAHGDQAVVPYNLETIARDVEEAAGRLRERRPEHLGQVVRDRSVLHNAPVLAGTRVPTAAIWDFHRAGYDAKAILAEYPRLTEEDIQAAIVYEERRHAPLVGS